MKVMVIPIVFGPLGTAHKSLNMKLRKMETRERIMTTQTTAQLRSARILSSVLES